MSERIVARRDSRLLETRHDGAIGGANPLERLITRLVRPGSALPIDSKVLRPMSTCLPSVSALKRRKSAGRRHGNRSPRPMTSFSATATTNSRRRSYRRPCVPNIGSPSAIYTRAAQTPPAGPAPASKSSEGVIFCDASLPASASAGAEIKADTVPRADRWSNGARKGKPVFGSRASSVKVNPMAMKYGEGAAGSCRSIRKLVCRDARRPAPQCSLRMRCAQALGPHFSGDALEIGGGQGGDGDGRKCNFAKYHGGIP